MITFQLKYLLLKLTNNNKLVCVFLNHCFLNGILFCCFVLIDTFIIICKLSFIFFLSFYSQNFLFWKFISESLELNFYLILLLFYWFHQVLILKPILPQNDFFSRKQMLFKKSGHSLIALSWNKIQNLPCFIWYLNVSKLLKYFINELISCIKHVYPMLSYKLIFTDVFNVNAQTFCIIVSARPTYRLTHSCVDSSWNNRVLLFFSVNSNDGVYVLIRFFLKFLIFSNHI